MTPPGAKASPGRLLLERLSECGCREGLREFDFTIGDEPCKFTFCNLREVLYGRVDPRSPRGSICSSQTWAKGARRQEAFETDRRPPLRPCPDGCGVAPPCRV